MDIQLSGIANLNRKTEGDHVASTLYRTYRTSFRGAIEQRPLQQLFEGGGQLGDVVQELNRPTILLLHTLDVLDLYTTGQGYQINILLPAVVDAIFHGSTTVGCAISQMDKKLASLVQGCQKGRRNESLPGWRLATGGHRHQVSAFDQAADHTNAGGLEVGPGLYTNTGRSKRLMKSPHRALYQPPVLPSPHGPRSIYQQGDTPTKIG